MDKNEIMVKSIDNVRKLIDNSILILKDIDTYFSDKGFVPILGNAIGTESSKSINQAYDSNGTFFPQFMLRPYVKKTNLENGIVGKLAAINIQFFHPKYDLMTPLVINGVFYFQQPIKDPKSELKNWWLKYAVLEYNQSERYSYEEIYSVKPFSDDNTEIKYWINPLTSIENQDDVFKTVEKLISLYNEEI
ncbi:hypothetical protein [Fredinandcohnia onubensis]|uniref:hypothetical protein n=1 Tax=Fredinandcohnia onubensis TaxID=1571209 RepID=UPI000C0C097E|nr:hypothetical protein [Fredinandcohnia onubensis]